MSMIETTLLYDFDPRWPTKVNMCIAAANYNGFVDGLESAIKPDSPDHSAGHKMAQPYFYRKI